MNYITWQKKKAKELTKARCFMVSGSDDGLASRVVQEVVSGLNVLGDYELLRFSRGAKVADMDAALNQICMTKRIVLIEDVQKIEDRDFIVDWLAASAGEPRDVLLVATADAVRPARGEERFIASNKQTAYIDCTRLSPESLVAYVSASLKIDDDLAGVVVERCIDVADVLGECEKLRLFEGQITELLVKQVIPPKVVDYDVVDALLEGRVDDVLQAEVTDMRAFLGATAHRMMHVAHLHLLVGRRLSTKDVLDRTQIPPQHLRKVAFQVKGLSWQQIMHRFLLLYDADRRVREGNSHGVLEMLVAKW